jgi:hypothetical protein
MPAASPYAIGYYPNKKSEMSFPSKISTALKTARRDFGDVVMLRPKIAMQNTAKWGFQNGTLSFQTHPNGSA